MTHHPFCINTTLYIIFLNKNVFTILMHSWQLKYNYERTRTRQEELVNKEHRVKKSNTALDEKEPLADLQFDTPKAGRHYQWHSHSQGFRRVWLRRRRGWWGQSQCAIPNPRMVFLQVQESSSCGPLVSLLVWYTAPSTAHCSVVKGYSVTQCTSKYTRFSHRFGTCN